MDFFFLINGLFDIQKSSLKPQALNYAIARDVFNLIEEWFLKTYSSDHGGHLLSQSQLLVMLPTLWSYVGVGNSACSMGWITYVFANAFH